jgi:Domain of unknown function (DUF4224)
MRFLHPFCSPIGASRASFFGEPPMSRTPTASSALISPATQSDWLLTYQELVALSGYRLSSAQRRWLDRQGLQYLLDAAGRPRVARRVVDLLLGVATSIDDIKPKVASDRYLATRPNFEALLDPQRKSRARNAVAFSNLAKKQVGR